jgi:hypothetical protein
MYYLYEVKAEGETLIGTFHEFIESIAFAEKKIEKSNFRIVDDKTGKSLMGARFALTEECIYWRLQHRKKRGRDDRFYQAFNGE